MIFHFTDPTEVVTPEAGGSKGAHLASMCRLGIPVPEGFIIGTDFCREYLTCVNQDSLMDQYMVDHIMPAYQNLCSEVGGTPLVSVRSGAEVSMPGMMDTLLNVGMTDANFMYWAGILGNRAALDCYSRLVYMFQDVVKGGADSFKELQQFVSELKLGRKTVPITPARYTAEHYQLLLNKYRRKYIFLNREVFPQTVEEQLRASVEAVFKSWQSPRAKHYRKMHNISEGLGTAVVIQRMVFGNVDNKSYSGVLFTRNPATGDNDVHGEYLIKAQGEDLVSGARTPMPISDMLYRDEDTFGDLVTIAAELERHYSDMQDIEFTVQSGELYILQTRTGKRTNAAAFRIAYDLAEEGIMPLEAVQERLSLDAYNRLSVTSVAPNFKTPADYKGLPASPGIVAGTIVLTSEKAVEVKAAQPDSKVILVVNETTPDHIKGMEAADAILTRTGGSTCHAAVVARAMNTPCVVGTTALKVGDLKHGTKITVDGSTGRVWMLVDVPVTTGSGTVWADKLLTTMYMQGEDRQQYLRYEARDYQYYETVPKSVVLGTSGIAPGCTESVVHKALDNLYDCGVEEVFIECTDAQSDWDSQDEAFCGMFALQTKAQNPHVVAALESYNGNARLLSMVLTNEKVKGFATTPVVKTIQDLLTREGVVHIDGELVSTIGGVEVKNLLLQTIRASGKNLWSPLPVSSFGDLAQELLPS